MLLDRSQPHFNLNVPYLKDKKHLICPTNIYIFYQDIDSQWKAEKNYQFSWDESQIQELQEEIYKLETEPSEQSLLGGLTSDQVRIEIF